MSSIHSASLPQDQQQRLHADFLANEQSYWKIRDSLLGNYRDQWVAVHDGKVVAANSDLLALTDEAAAAGNHPYIALVGSEETVLFRVRKAAFAYDQSYRPFALPRITATFWNNARTHSQTRADAIPDTGADLSVLPDSDCTAIDLFNSPYFTGISSRVLGPSAPTLIYRAKVEIDGRFFAALIQPVAGGQERIVGRDVLNQQRVLFDGLAGQVVIDP